ncbi:SubName: Full=Uncharacterized protein {ECO:0000313/EMBL:CCA70392.1} [Serendipita indica DSM 11827]|uniref:Uncharacterized protein n=1 Tax=Serendipita indica (strain DSM 11827) TaxID=1109443 RepID=G4TGE7_SERID|nr:SubName: Full=Uncharacterized protein {ECO:0000313/EMBL:CCA70392.1} [Serendipita indica DSM 11827]CCA70392.1 hypothetical protein PIIN_04331 [Serendipita indica DSM 11827]
MEHSPPTNGKLPRELLEIVFEDLCITIQDEDLDPVQMDRLLLVCRFWTTVALDYRRLWSSIFISLRSEFEYAFWTSYARTRLQRAGPTEPLQITLITKSLYNQTDQGEEIKILLSILTGPTGEVARRWKQLVFEPLRRDTPIGIYDRFFSFPTPKLEILQLARVFIHQTCEFLPDTTSLSRLCMRWCNIPPIKHVSSLTCLECDIAGAADASLLEQATRLEKYQCIGLQYWHLTRAVLLPRLLDLDIRTPLSSGSISRLVTPNLVKFCIRLSSSSDISRILDASGIPLVKLRELDLYSSSFGQQLDPRELRKLLLATPNLEKLRCRKPTAAIPVLNLLLEMDHLHETAPGLRFGCGDDTTLLGVGEEKRMVIMRFLRILKPKRGYPF